MTTVENTEAPKKKGRKKKEEWKDAAAASAAAEATARFNALKPRRSTESLVCILNDQEKIALGTQLLGKLAEEADLIAKRKAAGEQFGAQAKLAKQEANRIAAALRSGKEEREVETVEEYELRTCTLRVVRVDTGELVRERAMTTSERTAYLPGIDMDPKPAQADISAAIQPVRVSTAASRAQAMPTEPAPQSAPVPDAEPADIAPEHTITLDPDQIPIPDAGDVGGDAA